MMMNVDRNLRAALAYPERFGWPVFPCQPKGKKPVTPNGFQDATTDERKIWGWWTQYPDANIGIATGQISGIDVLDVDPRHGGDETLSELEAEHGKIPDTVESLTGGGGRHILFRFRAGVRNSAGRLPGLDVRGEGGYFIAPPSIHESGQEYAWEVSSRPGEVEITEWPEWLLDALQASNGKPQNPAPAVEEAIPEGRRNETLTSLAGTMRARGMGEEEIVAALLVANQRRCNPSLPEDEIRQIVASIMRYSPGNERTKPTEAPFVSNVSDLQGDFPAEDWPDPQPLPNEFPPVERFEYNLLPEAFRPWIEDIELEPFE